jgi:hypothetical protein
MAHLTSYAVSHCPHYSHKRVAQLTGVGVPARMLRPLNERLDLSGRMEVIDHVAV